VDGNIAIDQTIETVFDSFSKLTGWPYE